MSPQNEPPNAFLVHVHLDGVAPAIWRRLLVPPELSLGELHHVLQIVMGWDDAHLHDFRQGKGKAMRLLASSSAMDTDLPRADVDLPDEHEVTLSDVLTRKGSAITYVYDYGDHWAHIVRLEDRVLDSGPLPRCVQGERAAPPEDCGGVPGYEQCLDAFENPDADPDRAEWLEDWKPERFDLEEINAELSEYMTELEGDDVSPEMLEFLASPTDFGVTTESVERFKDAAADLADLLPGLGSIAGRLRAPDVELAEGILAVSDDPDMEDAWTVALFESVEDFLHELPGEEHEPRRVLSVAFQHTDMWPPEMRRLVGPGLLPIPSTLLAEDLKPPNQEELDLISACLELLAGSIDQWGTDEALPPPIKDVFEVAHRSAEIAFAPEADLCGRDGGNDIETRGLSLGNDDYEDEDDGTDEEAED